MIMNKEYSPVTIEVIPFYAEDVVTTSVGEGDGSLDG